VRSATREKPGVHANVRDIYLYLQMGRLKPTNAQISLQTAHIHRAEGRKLGANNAGK
jgi:hypothetical protein